MRLSLLSSLLWLHAAISVVQKAWRFKKKYIAAAALITKLMPSVACMKVDFIDFAATKLNVNSSSTDYFLALVQVFRRLWNSCALGGSKHVLKFKGA